MPANNAIRVEQDATALANTLNSVAIAKFATTTPAQTAEASAKSLVDAPQAESMWAPSIAAGVAIRADVLQAAAALSPHAAAVARQNEKALIDTIETDEQNAKDLTPHPVVET